jgi:K+-sensing histidine kinase KdpD
LNAILGYAQLLKKSEHREAREPADLISHSARHLLEMVENVLNQSKLESGRLKTTPNLIELEPFLSSVVAEIRELFSSGPVEFNVRREGPLPRQFFADETRLRQILHNLIGNAAKFTGSGQVLLRIRWRRGRLRFAVQDTGKGIQTQELGRIFLPFQQSLEKGSGTGLGLSISQELAQLMGSRIWVVSVVNLGSVFWFSLMHSEDPRDQSSVGIPIPNANESGAITSSSTLVAPPPEEVEELEQLLRIGDIGSITEISVQRMESGAVASDFYRLVHDYAVGFLMSPIRQLLERVKQ